MAQVVKGLHRSRNLEARLERVTCQSLSLLVDETRCCASCHRPLLDKVVVCFPSSGGQALCAKCGAQAQAQGNSYN
jgi:Vacuolar sorting protein 39 domain 2